MDALKERSGKRKASYHDEDHKKKKRHHKSEGESKSSSKKRDKHQAVKVVDDDVDDDEMWVERNIDVDGQHVRLVLSIGPKKKKKNSSLTRPRPAGHYDHTYEHQSRDPFYGRGGGGVGGRPPLAGFDRYGIKVATRGMDVDGRAQRACPSAAHATFAFSVPRRSSVGRIWRRLFQPLGHRAQAKGRPGKAKSGDGA